MFCKRNYIALFVIGAAVVLSGAILADDPPDVADYKITVSDPDSWKAELGDKLAAAAKESEPAGVFRFHITGIDLTDNVTRAYSHALLKSGWYVAARLTKDPKEMRYRAERIPSIIRDADLRTVRDISAQIAQTLLYACADIARTDPDKPSARTARLILDKSIDRRISFDPENEEYSSQLYIKSTGKRIDLAELAEGRIALR